MLGVENTSTKIKFDIYDIIEKYVLSDSGDYYEESAVDAVIGYFDARPNVPFRLCCAEWPNAEGGTCFFSWIENGNLNSLAFDYSKVGRV